MSICQCSQRQVHRSIVSNPFTRLGKSGTSIRLGQVRLRQVKIVFKSVGQIISQQSRGQVHQNIDQVRLGQVGLGWCFGFSTKMTDECQNFSVVISSTSYSNSLFFPQLIHNAHSVYKCLKFVIIYGNIVFAQMKRNKTSCHFFMRYFSAQIHRSKGFIFD